MAGAAANPARWAGFSLLGETSGSEGPANEMDEERYITYGVESGTG